jgi:hypothetical protein
MDAVATTPVVVEECDAPAPKKLSWYMRKSLEDPTFKETYKIINRGYYEARRERDPEAFREQKRAAWVNRYRNDPVFRAKNVAASRAYRARKKEEKNIVAAAAAETLSIEETCVQV